MTALSHTFPELCPDSFSASAVQSVFRSFKIAGASRLRRKQKFFKRVHISSALISSNAYKKKGIPVIEVFQYLFLLIFSNRSMYMSLITGRNTPGFAKDTVYRFMKMLQINWIRFTTLLASRIIRNAIVPLDSEDRANVLIIDDSMFERNRSKKVELLAKAYDHANH